MRVTDNPCMRLTPDQVHAIKQTAHHLLSPDARFIPFGSRTDDTRRGGDIDLLFETQRQLDNRALTAGAIYTALIRQLGDRKIDILLKDACTANAPVIQNAIETGVEL